MLRSRLAQLQKKADKSSEAIATLEAYITPERKGEFFAEYAALTVAVLYEAESKYDEARAVLGRVESKRFAVEIAELLVRIEK